MNTWVILRDVDSGGTTLQNLDTREHKDIAATALQGQCGLRRGLVVYDHATGRFRETGEFLPWSDELGYELEEAYRQHDGQDWIFDWPHWQVEADESRYEVLRERLEAQMAPHPFDFQIIGLQRRFVLYYSDGNYKSQKFFERLAPRAASYPYRRDGQLWSRYRHSWSHLMRDAGIAYPKKFEQEQNGGLRPMLYSGPAWVVRFLLDGQQILPNCLMYVDDEGQFLFSSWCQRHDQTSYHDGINLQLGVYTFDSWIVTSAVQRALREKRFTPKGVQVKIFKPADLKNQPAQPVRSFEDLLAAEIAKRPKPVVKQPSALELAFREAAGEGDLQTASTAFVDGILAEGITAARRLPLPIQSPLSTAHEYNRPAMAPFTKGDMMHFTTVPWAEDTADHPPTDASRLCVRDAQFTYHFHLRTADCRLDETALRDVVGEYVEAIAAERRANAPLPPLSADTMALVRAQMEALLAQPRAPKAAPPPEAPETPAPVRDEDGWIYVAEPDGVLALTDLEGTTTRWRYDALNECCVRTDVEEEEEEEEEEVSESVATECWNWYHYGRPLGLVLCEGEVWRFTSSDVEGVLRREHMAFDSDSESYEMINATFVQEAHAGGYGIYLTELCEPYEQVSEITATTAPTWHKLFTRVFQEHTACV